MLYLRIRLSINMAAQRRIKQQRRSARKGNVFDALYHQGVMLVHFMGWTPERPQACALPTQECSASWVKERLSRCTRGRGISCMCHLALGVSYRHLTQDACPACIM
jgi:hypothetical protein